MPRSAKPSSSTAEAGIAAASPVAKAKRARKPAPAPASQTLLSREEIVDLFERFERLRPEPRTELGYTNPYTLLIAVVLSAHTTDKSVNQATENLFPVADTPEKMVALGEEGVLPFIRKVGLYRGKTKNVVALSRILIEQHGGQVPRTREALEELPGVGRKTARVVLNSAFGEPVIAVDTHIFRVSNRTGLALGKNPDKVAEVLEAVVPDRYKRYAHHWLLLHGRYVCVARRPKCPVCPIADLCRYEDKTPTL